MVELSFYDAKKESWVDAEENGKPIEFEDRQAAEEWLEKNNEEAIRRGCYHCYEYIICRRCGRQVSLDGFTNTCECGADYNGFGQLLAPREQWGYETGETAAEILGVDVAGGAGDD